MSSSLVALRSSAAVKVAVDHIGGNVSRDVRPLRPWNPAAGYF